MSDKYWSTANRPLLVARLAALLEQHDQRRSDLSFRAEGTCQTIVVLAELMELQANEKIRLADAIMKCFEQYNQIESKIRWPANRFAVAAMEVLGFKRSTAQRAA